MGSVMDQGTPMDIRLLTEAEIRELISREEALAVMLWAGEALLTASLREASTDSSRWRTTTPEHA